MTYIVLRRIFAKILDLCLISPMLLIPVILHIELYHPVIANNPQSDTVLQMTSCVIFFLLEPIFVAKFGFTPGKFLMGLRLYNLSGEKLDYMTALNRNWIMMQKVLSLTSIPRQISDMYYTKTTAYDKELGIKCSTKDDFDNNKDDEFKNAA
jgi:uncharacterized RDD family membrane protein YckC